jgi:hypothetical protein
VIDFYRNCNFFCFGGNTLNVVGVDNVVSCQEATLHFSTIQEVYNFFERNRRICWVLKKPLSVTLHVITKTKWSALFTATEEVAKYFSSIPAAVEEAERPNICTSACTETLSLKGQLDALE